MEFNGICYYELLGQHETVNHSRYIQFFNNLMYQWGKNHEHTIWLLDDNVRHSTLYRHSSVETWLDQHNVERWIQPPRFPDLIPYDYGCFDQDAGTSSNEGKTDSEPGSPLSIHPPSFSRQPSNTDSRKSVSLSQVS
ncbi:unnamed protein product [Euphydryas editha]|uniref:Uncharacterized protein n=1 Tax=Euphydryas editha TaxID=104508 RepID=A0AAU9U3T7_EUPED|nr:unnamed protein product [Euphydryas editha]